MLPLATAVLLAGCESRPDPLAYDAIAPAAEPQQNIVTVKPRPDVAVLESEKPLPRPVPHVLPRPPVPDAPIPELVGLDEQQLTGLLGPPTSQTGNGPGKQWIYRMRKCTLNLSLFPNVHTHAFHSLSYEVTTNDRHGDGQRCRSELAEWLRERQVEQARND